MQFFSLTNVSRKRHIRMARITERPVETRDNLQFNNNSTRI